MIARKVHTRIIRRNKKLGNYTVEATWTELDGNRRTELFDSMAEAKRWKVLINWEDEGRITNLQRAVDCGYTYELQPGFRDMHGKKWQAWTYTPDFVYVQDGIEIVEDYKSKHPPAEWRHKELMFRSLYPEVHFFVNERIRGVYEPPTE